ncbi:MAG: SocA family protein [Alphaproteobacteria bacterium]|nr:SocA family protein [Alphaproteobacteria bacterium]
MSIRFRFNGVKALNAVLWLCEKQPGITFHTISKVVYYADKKHLTKYGRPIIGDMYAAMPAGPVPSGVYDLLKGDEIQLESLGLESRPFSVKHRYHVYVADYNSDMDVFSESDVEMLEESFAENAHLDFKALVDKTHAELDYAEAPGHWMRYEDFIPVDMAHRGEIIEDLTGCAHRMVM